MRIYKIAARKPWIDADSAELWHIVLDCPSSDISREVNRRFGDKMRSATDGRRVSVNLRRLEERGRIRLVRKGRSYSEALYALPALG